MIRATIAPGFRSDACGKDHTGGGRSSICQVPAGRSLEWCRSTGNSANASGSAPIRPPGSQSRRNQDVTSKAAPIPEE